MGELGLLPFSEMPAWAVSVAIFTARIVDVSLGTIRIIVVGRGMRWTASLLGFVEVLIWLTAIGMVMQNLHGWVNFLMYCGGFATGTFVGMTIERRFEMGRVLIRIVVPHEQSKLVNFLSDMGIRVTYLSGKSTEGPALVIFMVVRRKQLRKVVDIVHTHEPDAFYSVEDVRYAAEKPLSTTALIREPVVLQPFYWFRKSK